MNRKKLLGAINGIFFLALLISACTINEQSSNLPTRTTDSSLLTDMPSNTPALVTSTPEGEKAQPTTGFSTTVTQELVITLPSTSSLPVTATTTATTPETTLKGPLIGFRVHNEKGVYLLILQLNKIIQ